MQQHLKAKRTWRRLLRRCRCTCGLPWPCIEVYVEACRRREADRIRTAITDPAPSIAVDIRSNPVAWDAPTMPLFQVARAGTLTPAQEHRAGGVPSC
ncbi:hypothetical protein [Actinoplanes subglobosus]|uniref:Uncharacterized protein n=1 Tax=Actinoplanes subglobosus TaxID=1547892 RepID=A0ABV8JBQ2_9ACTN